MGQVKVKSEVYSKSKYEKVVESKKFQDLIGRKKRFIIPCTVFFLVFYFVLPLMTSYSTILNTKAISDITWAWVFAIGQFIMTWTLLTMYMRKSAFFDKLAQEVIEDEIKGGNV